MRIHKYGHACLVVEVDSYRLLIDPGEFSSGFEELTDVDAVLVTHSHLDHLSVENIARLLAKNPKCRIFADRDSGKTLRSRDLDCTVVSKGDEFNVGPKIQVVGDTHATIHEDLPKMVNHGYLIDGRLFHPGDALTIPDAPVEVLALPIGAPWLKSEEFINYLRSVNPAYAIPIHDAVLAKPSICHRLVEQLGPPNVAYQVIPDGDYFDIG